MSRIELSKLDLTMSLEQVIDYLLDKDCDTIINDYAPEPQIEYDLSDLKYVWKHLTNKTK